jgi:hypothetical protein
VFTHAMNPINQLIISQAKDERAGRPGVPESQCFDLLSFGGSDLWPFRPDVEDSSITGRFGAAAERSEKGHKLPSNTSPARSLSWSAEPSPQPRGACSRRHPCGEARLPQRADAGWFDLCRASFYSRGLHMIGVVIMHPAHSIGAA